MKNRCPSCNRTTDEDICPHCGVITDPIAEGEENEKVVPPSPPPPPAPPPPPPEEEAAYAPRPPPPLPEEKAPFAPPPVEEPVPATPLIPPAGQQQLEEYINDGYEVFLIAGIAAAGKTQLLDAYRQDAYLADSVKKRHGLALPTNPQNVDCHPVAVGRRKVVFADTSGEHFKHLYPGLAPTGEIQEAEIDFLRLISRNLRGVVLLIDLQRLWNPALRTNPEDAEQVKILTWILVLLRWLRYDGLYTSRRIRFQDYVNRECMRLRWKLRVPVLGLFSKADELTGLAIPQTAGENWLRRADATQRNLFPAGEDALLVAHHCLPDLLVALQTHVHNFRFDFIHSLVTDRDTGEVIDPTACGVALSIRWLLDASWRWPAIPTRYWIALQRFVDDRIKRDDRWQRLPHPEDVN